ncbi:A-kinase-interacting protein 1 [Aix galericulata]|nr:A-kinase-interacting protein 1 [Aix galericulata]
MDGARTAGMARAVLERARRRREEEEQRQQQRREREQREQRAREPPALHRQHPARLGAAFASLGGLLQRAAAECEEYYRCVPAWRCNEHEVKHICRYHSRQAGEEEFKSSKEETRKASKDIYIEVSPGTYSITATSEDMVKQTHVVDVFSERPETWVEEATRHQNRDGSSRCTWHRLTNSTYNHSDRGKVASRLRPVKTLSIDKETRHFPVLEKEQAFFCYV